MASPQVEDGYTKVANEILEQTMKTRFSGTQKDIVLCIWRYTYGFGRKEHKFAVDFLAEATMTDEKLVRDNLKVLIERNIIIVIQEFAGTRSRIMTFNKNYEQWIGRLERGKLPSLSNRRKETEKTENTLSSIPKIPSLERGKLPSKKEKRKSLKKEEICIEKIKFLDAVFLTQVEYDNLLNLYGKEELDDWIFSLNVWLVNNPKNQKKVSDHNLTIQNWKRREDKKQKQIANRPSFKQQQNQAQDDILKNMFEEGEREQAGNGNHSQNNQNRLPSV